MTLASRHVVWKMSCWDTPTAPLTKHDLADTNTELNATEQGVLVVL